MEGEATRRVIVTIIGDSDTRNKEELEFAETLGIKLAQKGFLVLTGGRGGVMEAVCRGVKKAGGITIGIIPDEKASGANPYVDIVIPTGLGWLRNVINVLAASIVIAIGGKSGTLSEIAFAWMYGKPIIAVSGFSGWSEKLAGKRLDDRREDIIYSAKSVDEVIRKIEEILQE